MSHNLHNFSPGQEFLTPSKYKHASSIETNPSMNLPSFASNQYSAIELSESLGTSPSFYSPNKELGSFWMTPSNTLARERSGLESDLRLKTESVLEVSEMQEVSPMKDNWQHSKQQSYPNSAERSQQYPPYQTFSPTKPLPHVFPTNPPQTRPQKPQPNQLLTLLLKIRHLSLKSQQQQLHLNHLSRYNSHLTQSIQEKYQQVKQHKEYVETLLTKKKQLQKKVNERKNQRKLKQKQMEREIKEKIQRLEREIDERDMQFDKDARRFQYIMREVDMVARLAEEKRRQEEYHRQHQHHIDPYAYPYNYPIMASKTYSSTKRLQPDLHYLSQPNTARSNLNEEHNATFNFNNLNPEVHAFSQPKGSIPHEQGQNIMGLMQRALQGQFGQGVNQQNGQNSGHVVQFFRQNPNGGYPQPSYQQYPNSSPSQPIFQQNPNPQPSLGQMLQRGLMQKLLQQQSSSSTVHINLQSSPSQSPNRQLPQPPSFSIHHNDHNRNDHPHDHIHDHHRQRSQPSRLESSVLPYIEPPESTLSCSQFPQQIVIPSPTRLSPFGNLSPVGGKSIKKEIDLALVRQLYRVQGDGQHEGYNQGQRSQLQQEEKQLELMINSISQSPQTQQQHETTQSVINIRAQSLQSSPQKRSIPFNNPPQIHSARGSNPPQHHKRVSSGDISQKHPQDILQSQVNINYQSSEQSDNLYRNHEFFVQENRTVAYDQGYENPNRKRSPTHLEQKKMVQLENIRKTIDVPKIDPLERNNPSEASKDNSDETPGFRSSCHESDVRFSQPLIASFKNSQHMNAGLGHSQKVQEHRQDVRQVDENQESSQKRQTGRNTLSQSSVHVGTQFQPSLPNQFVPRHQLKIASPKEASQPTFPNNQQHSQPINPAQTHFTSLPNQLQSKYKPSQPIEQVNTWPNQPQKTPQNPPEDDDDDFFSCTLGTESVIDTESRRKLSIVSKEENKEDKSKNFISEGKIKYTMDPSYDNQYDDEIFQDFGQEVRHTNQSVIMKSSKKQNSPSAKRYSLQTPPSKVAMKSIQTVIQAQSDEQDQGKKIKTSRRRLPQELSKSTI